MRNGVSSFVLVSSPCSCLNAGIDGGGGGGGGGGGEVVLVVDRDGEEDEEIMSDRQQGHFH